MVTGTGISRCIQERERVGAKGSGVNRYKQRCQQRCKLEEREGWEWVWGSASQALSEGEWLWVTVSPMYPKALQVPGAERGGWS